MAGYSQGVHRPTRGTKLLNTAARAATRTFRLMGRMVGPAVGGAGIVGVAAFGIAGAKAFGNLNTEMNSSIQLAGMLNLAFRYTVDPAENFVIAMKNAKDVFRDVIQLTPLHPLGQSFSTF